MKKIILIVSVFIILSCFLFYNNIDVDITNDITPSQRLSVMQTSEEYTPSQNLAITEKRYIDAYNSIKLMNG